jgi:predicted nuclease with TOPRIM domain
MKRPHRSIETFDISLMAVVTKAMGAFLVLMLLLIPYYSSSPLGQDEAQELTKKVQDADAKIKGVLDKLGDKSLGGDLVLAREELGSGEQLIGQLKRYVDQLSAQVTRLEDRIASLTAEIEQLKRDKAALATQVTNLQQENDDLRTENESLKAENEKLKAEIEELKKHIAELEKQIEDLKKRIAELEKKIEELNKEIAELKKSEPEKVEELKKKIEELEKEIARLKKLIEDLNAKIASLQSENARLNSRVSALEQENARLTALVAPLQQENADLKARIAELEEELRKLRRSSAQAALAVSAQSVDCANVSIGIFSPTMYRADPSQTYIFNFLDSLGINAPSQQKGGRYVSAALYSRIAPGRYFLMLVSRKAEQHGDEPRGVLGHHGDGEDQPGDGGGTQSGGGGEPSQAERKPPLQPLSKSCRAVVSVVLAAAGSGLYYTHAVVFDAGQAVQYFNDVIIGSDWKANVTDPSPEGQAWLKDQLVHADIVPAEAPQAPSVGGGVPAIPAAPGVPAPQAAPNNAPPTPDAGNRRGRRGE